MTSTWDRSNLNQNRSNGEFTLFCKDKNRLCSKTCGGNEILVTKVIRKKIIYISQRLSNNLIRSAGSHPDRTEVMQKEIVWVGKSHPEMNLWSWSRQLYCYAETNCSPPHNNHHPNNNNLHSSQNSSTLLLFPENFWTRVGNFTHTFGRFSQILTCPACPAAEVKVLVTWSYGW